MRSILLSQFSNGINRTEKHWKAYLMNYDYVVSLGANCEVAHHIERYFSIKRRNPFDWWITPFNGLVDALETDFEHLFRDARVEQEIKIGRAHV